MDIKVKKTTFVAIVAVCLVLLALGLFGLVQQYLFVEGATAINSYVPWGLYISLFLFFEAVGAGALLFAALGKPAVLSRLKLAVIGVVCSACAGLAILPDLGRPLAMWRLFFAPNMASPLLLDVWLLSATLVFGVLLIAGLRFAKPTLARVGSIGSAVFAVLLVLGTAVMFCSIPGKIGWESTAEIGVAIAQTALAGCAAVLLFKGVVGSTRDKIVRAAAVLIAVNGAIMLGEGMLLFYRGDFALLSFEAVMFGTYAPLFWAQVIAGMIAPAVMLLMRKGIAVASGLALAGVLISKYVYVMRGSIYPTYGEMSETLSIPFLQPSTGIQMIQPYVPTVNEFMVAGAVIALAVLLITLALNSALVPSDKPNTQA